MASIKIPANNSRGASLEMDNIQQPPPKRSISVAKYKVYLALGAKPLSRSANPRNLFDDSNSEDKKWLELARRYLMKAR